MRISALILILLTLIQVKADHLLGGEVTYDHISGTEFYVNVTLYRDCNGSKLGGTGGGSSSNNHLDLNAAHLRTSNTGTCSNSNQYLGKINLTKLGYEEITPVCSNVRTACKSNPNFSYGIEAHHYQGKVDFDKFSTYSGCMLEIYISISDRTNNMTTINGGTNFFNYAMIDPWTTQTSSPKFNEYPKILYTVAKPVIGNPSVTSSKGDSLSYRWSSPYKAIDETVTYKNGFSAQRFVTPYCSNPDLCTADPNKAIPEGIYLDKHTGNYAFTPIEFGEIANMVIEVEQWVDFNNEKRLIGVIRRDVALLVGLNDPNNPPKIQSNYVYDVCVGQTLEFDISASDNSYTLPGGGTSNSDSVKFKIAKSLNSIRDSVYYTSQAPFQKVHFSLAATASMVGEHTILVKATDNFCPNYASASRLITIRVNPIPTFDFNVEDQFCGNNLITLSTASQGSANLNIAYHDVSSNFANFTSLNYRKYDTATIQYSVVFTSNHGCSANQTKRIFNNGNTQVSKASIIGDLEYCDSEKTQIVLRHSNYTISDISWKQGVKILSSDTTLNVLAFEGLFSVKYVLLKDNLKCELINNNELKLNALPILSVEDLNSICEGAAALDLNNIDVKPADGVWSSNMLTIDKNIVDLSAAESKEEGYLLNYEYTDPTTGCISSIDKKLDILPSPKMLLKDVVICGDKNNYRLTNSIVQPIHFSPEVITWEVIGHSNAVIGSHPFADLDIETLGSGTYTIIGTNIYSNGCVSEDTSWVKVDEGLTITTNGNTSFCQGNDPVNLVKHLGINAPGGIFTSMDIPQNLANGFFIPNKCGTYSLEYSYDAFGCFAQTQFQIEVICKPEIELNVPEILCANSDPIQLKANIAGTWSGDGVSNAIFNPAGQIGVQKILFTSGNISGCNFNELTEINVLPSAAIQVDDVPTAICEGEELTFKVTNDANSKLSFEACKLSNISFDNIDKQLSYLPGNCDLSKASILITIKADINKNCPSAIKNVTVDYHELPKVYAPIEVSACYPYNLDHQLSLKSGVDVTINSNIYTNLSQHLEQGKNLQYSFPKAGLYSLELSMSDVTGCTNTQKFPDIYKINPKPKAEFDVSRDGYITLSERDIYLYNYSSISAGSMDFKWSYEGRGIKTLFSDQTNPYLELPVDTGKYKLILDVKSKFGCVDQATKDLILVPDILVFIPNAFTPDQIGPQENGRFKVTSVNTKEIHIQVFNRYGQKVYESFDIDEYWDGKFGGKQCQTGVYLYKIDIVNMSGLPYQYNGTVTLIR